MTTKSPRDINNADEIPAATLDNITRDRQATEDAIKREGVRKRREADDARDRATAAEAERASNAARAVAAGTATGGGSAAPSILVAAAPSFGDWLSTLAAENKAGVRAAAAPAAQAATTPDIATTHPALHVGSRGALLREAQAVKNANVSSPAAGARLDCPGDVSPPCSTVSCTTPTSSSAGQGATEHTGRACQHPTVTSRGLPSLASPSVGRF